MGEKPWTQNSLHHLCRERNLIPSRNCFTARRVSIWREGRNGCQQTNTHTGGCHLFFPHTQRVTYYHQHVRPRLTSGVPSPAVTMPFPSFFTFVLSLFLVYNTYVCIYSDNKHLFFLITYIYRFNQHFPFNKGEVCWNMSRYVAMHGKVSLMQPSHKRGKAADEAREQCKIRTNDLKRSRI